MKSNTQNAKIEAITEKTLVLGIDVGSEMHIILKQEIEQLYRAYEACLKETEKIVLRSRYGLFGGKEQTQREIAARLGISRSYVSRIEKRALEKMRRGFAEHK